MPASQAALTITVIGAASKGILHASLNQMSDVEFETSNGSY
jgi:hypothetical protein